jgi:hypothetical protein
MVHRQADIARRGPILCWADTEMVVIGFVAARGYLDSRTGTPNALDRNANSALVEPMIHHSNPWNRP